LRSIQTSADRLLEAGHARRRLLHACVKANPGIGLRELARTTGIPPTSVAHHLTILKRHGLITEGRSGRCCFFLDASMEIQKARAAAMQRDTALREVLDWLAAHPEAPQIDILTAMEDLGWSRSTTQYRLRRLAGAGLVSASGHTGRIRYRIERAIGGTP
jgi:predicted transcriptional regulator